jgi:hypothetical protein
MRRDRIAYLLFAVVGFVQLGVLLLIGETRIDKGGLLVLIVLVAWLGRRSRAAWLLFVIANLWLLLATIGLSLGSTTQTLTSLSSTGSRVTHVITTASPGSRVIWGDVITTVLGSGMLLAILLSRSMRTWVRPPANA